MNFILEGPDGSGKSYLANVLAENLNLSIRHFGAPTTKVEIAQQYHMYMDVADSIYNTILDRSWYSDMVYGPIYRGAAHITKDMMWRLENKLEDTILIYCTGDPKLMWKAAKKRGETYVKSFKDYEKICIAYNNVILNYKHYIPVHIRKGDLWLEKMI